LTDEQIRFGENTCGATTAQTESGCTAAGASLGYTGCIFTGGTCSLIKDLGNQVITGTSTSNFRKLATQNSGTGPDIERQWLLISTGMSPPAFNDIAPTNQRSLRGQRMLWDGKQKLDQTCGACHPWYELSYCGSCAADLSCHDTDHRCVNNAGTGGSCADGIDCMGHLDCLGGVCEDCDKYPYCGI
jgi:hypothetical protein